MNVGNEVVIYIDVLSFAALTEKYQIDLKELKIRGRVDELDFQTGLPMAFLQPPNHLMSAFKYFHRAIEGTLNIARSN